MNHGEQSRMEFRELVRINRKIPEEECTRILKEELRGVLSLIGDGGYPYGMPLNHYYNEEDGKLYFHSGMKGHKIDALKQNPKASYCVMDKGYRNEGEWALNIKSVIVFGTIEIIEDKETIYDISRRLSYKFTDDEAYIENEIKQSGPGTFMFALVPEHISGKLVNEA